MRQLTAIIFVLSVISMPAGGSTEDEYEVIRRSIIAGSSDNAIDALLSIKATKPDIFSLNNFAYSLGRVTHRSGRVDIAAANYVSVIRESSQLAPLAGWHLAETARMSGNAMLERLLLMEVRASGSLLPYQRAAADRIARSYYENGDLRFALNEFQNAEFFGGIPRASGEPQSRSVALMIAETQLGTGQTVEARASLFELISKQENRSQPDDVSLAAVIALDRLDGSVTGETTPRLSPGEHIERARVYQFNRRFDESRGHYERIINEHATGEFSAEAVYQIGRGYSQQSRFSEAIIWYERLIEQFPEAELVKDALLQAGSAYSRVGKFKESIQRYQMFADRYPSDQRVDRAYLNMIDVARDLGEETEAIRRARTAQEVFRGKTAEAQALFAEARILIAREEWLAADEALQKLERLTELGGNRVPGGTSLAEIRFLRGYVLKMRREHRAALDAFLSVPDGFSDYYGSLATSEIQKMATAPETAELVSSLAAAELARGSDRNALRHSIRLTTGGERTRLLDELRKIYLSLPEFADAKFSTPREFKTREVVVPGERSRARRERGEPVDELIFLGVYDEAIPILEAKGRFENVDELAAFYEQIGRADKTIRHYEHSIKLPVEMPLEAAPVEQLKRLYPVPFRDILLRESSTSGIDPRFLLAIMRQESRFDPYVKSGAAARGLMQFIPSTAERIAGRTGLPGFRQDDLFDPSIAIKFGAEYCAELFRLFPNMPEAVAASYNGGEDNMQRWQGRARSNEPGRYVPEIMYSQSKDYVFKVMANYRIYSHLYDEELREK